MAFLFLKLTYFQEITIKIQFIFLTFAVQNFTEMNAVQFVHDQLTNKAKLPAFKAGDKITVNYKIVEGSCYILYL